MTRTSFEGKIEQAAEDKGHLTFQAHGTDRIDLPSGDFIADAHMTRDGNDLILEAPNGEVAVIEGYFAADPAPLLHSPEGAVLTPDLVDSFAKSPQEYAANNTASDQSPVGAVEEVKGEVKVTRADGTVETVTIGTPIYEGDIIETDASGAVNITFIDETSMAISENARMAIDQYTFDPSTESGTTNFSVLRGLFVFTSGLIGRDDPDDVHINTPVGSIGIRGTIIAGEINPDGQSNISVLEGAIVVKNGLGETTLSDQYETVKLNGFDKPMESLGVVPAEQINTRFNSISTVAPTLFSTISETVHQQSAQPTTSEQPHTDAPSDKPVQQETAPQQQLQQEAPQAPAAPAPEPVTQVVPTTEIVSLNNTSTGLPSATTVMGQTETLVTTTNTAPAPTTATPSPALPPPPPVTTITATQPTPPPPVIVTQPPPTVIGGGTVTTPPPGPLVKFTPAGVTDIAGSGTLLGVLAVENMATSTFTFANGSTTSANGYYTISGNQVFLTTTGAQFLSGSLDKLNLPGFGIIATDINSVTANGNFVTPVTDANASMIINLNNPLTAGVSYIVDGLDNHAGYSITAIGDIDHNGFADFMFSNDTTSPTQNHSYKVLGSGTQLVDGNVPGLTTTVGNGTNVNGNGQTVIEGIGDFDGDGTVDFVVGQENNFINSIASGNFAIRSGDSNEIVTFATGSVAGGERIGADVDGAGDYNNDGYADVIIGAAGYGSGNGGAYLIKGGSSLWGTSPSTTSILPSTPGASAFGSSVTGIGDFNGDGYSDFAVGAPEDGSNNEGSVAIYFGNKNGDVSLGNFHFLTTTNINTSLGTEVSSLGDINGDGRSDLLVAGAGTKGFILFGRDMTSDLDVATNANAQFNIPGSYNVIGGGSAGDFNGDGYDDFTVSLADASGSKTYVVFGKSGFGGTIDLTYLKNPTNAMELQYGNANGGDEIEIKGIGDINGDGYDDIAMGVPDLNGSANGGNGGVIVVYGRSGGATVAGNVATANNQALVGNDATNLMGDGGFTDVSLRGGAGNDVFGINNTSFRGIDGGTQTSGGYDTILMKNSLDFSGINFEKISGIEMLQYEGTGKTVTLTIENIFNLLKTSDTGDLKIDSAVAGNTLNINASSATNIVDALNEMGNGATDVGAAGGYNHFKIGGYDLYIDQDVTVNVT